MNMEGSLRNGGNSLAFKKGKNLAVAAVARKMAVSTWYHLKGFETNFDIPSKSIDTKIQKMSQKLGKEIIISMGYENPREFKLKIKEKLIA